MHALGTATAVTSALTRCSASWSATALTPRKMHGAWRGLRHNLMMNFLSCVADVFSLEGVIVPVRY